MANAIEIAGSNFETELLQSDVPVLVDFSATCVDPVRKWLSGG